MSFEYVTESTIDAVPDALRRAVLPRGTCVERYLIVDRVGQGGMGVVYKAYDPQLDRPIALKLLRTSGAALHGRLMREAQALAQLSHPNVIAVHDVGVFGEELFVAMELVEGQTLRAWLKENRPSHAQILDVFLAAGEGLAAAHRARLVHRDFKPENVMVGNDGRVRVLDFGLACASRPGSDSSARGVTELPTATPSPVLESLAATPTPPVGAATISVANTNRQLGSPLTRVGATLGTPRYMAPEQHLAGAIDEGADQFSFCVSLYEALYGSMPFAGAKLSELRENVTAGRIEDGPSASRVPRWLRHVLLRGLRVRPEERYPSMAALLAALRDDPRVKQRRRQRIVLAAGALMATVLAWRGLERHQRQVCAGAERKLTDVWDEPRRLAVRAAFARTSMPFAATALRAVEQGLDAYTSGWVAMHVDACEATQLRREQSAEALDLRMTCLGERLGEVRALTEQLATADVKVVERAVQSLESLPPVASCADLAALRSPMPLPADPATRAQVGALRLQLARAGAFNAAARYADGLTLAQDAVSEAKSIGYGPVTAEAQLTLGRLQSDHGDHADAALTLEAALLSAVATRDDEVAAHAALKLLRVVGERLSRHDDGNRWAELAQALVDRLHRPELVADFHLARGSLRFEEGRLAEAERDAQQALDRYGGLPAPPGHRVAETYEVLGDVQYARAQLPEALASYERARAGFEQTVGKEHPLVGSVMISIANVEGDLGRNDRALAMYRSALRIFERVNPKDLEIGTVYTDIGSLLLDMHRPDDAMAALAHALSLWEPLGPSTSMVVTLNNMGAVELERDRLDAANAAFARAQEIGNEVLGPNNTHAVMTSWGLGEVCRRRKQLHDARGHFLSAIAIGDKLLGGNHPNLVDPLLALGRTYLDEARTGDALAPLERALALADANAGSTSLPEVQATLAEALWLHGDRGRALTLGALAERTFAARNEQTMPPARQLSAWLAKRR